MPKPEKQIVHSASYPKAPPRDDSGDLPFSEDGVKGSWKIGYAAGKEVLKVACPCCGTAADASPADVTKDNFLAMTVVCPSTVGCKWFGYVYLKDFHRRYDVPGDNQNG